MKIKNMKLMLLGLLAMGGMNAFAQTTFEDDNFKYTVTTAATSTVNGQVTLDETVNPMSGAWNIPGEVSKTTGGVTYKYDVITIKTAALQNQAGMTSLTIPAQVKEIETQALNGCTNLAELTFASGSKLTTLGDGALATTQIKTVDFTNCTLLKTLPTYLFTESAILKNEQITTITLPTGLTNVSTALANLPGLTTINLSETSITSVAANFLKADTKLTKLELPNTVQTIATDAFTGSKVADLTINVDAIEPTAGIGANVYATADKATLTKLTLKGTLKGKIASNAFNDHDKIANGDLVLSGLNFGTNASIEGNAFGSLDLIESITLGNIGDNGSGVYTIGTNAFNGTKLTSVTIGDITAPNAIDASAFDNGTATLTSVTIKSVKSGGVAINAAAFNFATIATKKKATVTIGAVRALDLATEIFGAGAFTFNTANAGAAEIKIGAIESAGSIFGSSAVFANATFNEGITLTFDGDIEYNGIGNAPLSANTNLTTLVFNGKVGKNAIGANTFAGMADKAKVTFNEELYASDTDADRAVAANSFTMTAGNTLTVEYKANPANTSVIPFSRTAFLATQLTTSDADRKVTLTVSNAALKEFIKAGQISISDATNRNNDIIYDVVLLATADLGLVVYQKTGTTNSYGRFYLNTTDYPNGLKISRRGHDGMSTLTLYSTYVEDDATNKVVTINMQPIPTEDGFYYLPSSVYSSGLVIIAKATGTSAEETKIEFEEYTGTPSTIFTPTTGQVKKYAGSDNVTWQQMVDNTTTVAEFQNLFNTEKKQVKDIYFLSNPADHKGISANTWDIIEKKVYVAPNSFYAVTNHYDGASAARIVWLDGSEETTAISAVKNVAEDGIIYNLAGQQVDANYKGIVIKNGKKMIQK